MQGTNPANVLELDMPPSVKVISMLAKLINQSEKWSPFFSLIVKMELIKCGVIQKDQVLCIE